MDKIKPPGSSEDISGCCGHRVNAHDKNGCLHGWQHDNCGITIGPDGCICVMRGPAPAGILPKP